MRTIQPTSDLQAEIVANVREAFAELRCLGSERMHRADISMTHFHLLSMLERHGSITMSRIAELLGVSVSNATGLIVRGNAARHVAATYEWADARASNSNLHRARNSYSC